VPIVTKSVSNISFIAKSIQFLREVKVELKKVTWPSRKQTMGSTLVVIILVMIISLFLGVVDMGQNDLAGLLDYANRMKGMVIRLFRLQWRVQKTCLLRGYA